MADALQSQTGTQSLQKPPVKSLLPTKSLLPRADVRLVIHQRHQQQRKVNYSHWFLPQKRKQEVFNKFCHKRGSPHCVFTPEFHSLVLQNFPAAPSRDLGHELSNPPQEFPLQQKVTQNKIFVLFPLYNLIVSSYAFMFQCFYQ